MAMRLLATAVAALVCEPQTLRAHPLSLSTLQANVEEGAIEAFLHVMVEDLMLFQELQSGPDFRIPLSVLEAAAHEHARELTRDVVWRTEDGNQLPMELVSVDTSDLPATGVHLDELKVYRIVFRFRIALVERPEFLTLMQSLGGDEPPVPSEMTVRLFHQGVLIDQILLMHGAAYTTRLDWDLDWETLRRDPETVRALLRQRIDEDLGITVSSVAYSFLYLKPEAVRLELLIPLLVLDQWMDLPFEDQGRLSIQRQRELRQRIYRQVAEQFALLIAGEPRSASLERIQFHGPRPQDMAMTAPETDIYRHNGRVSLMLTLPLHTAPREIAFRWKDFTGMVHLQTSFYPFDERRQNHVLDPSSPSFSWTTDTPPSLHGPRPRPAPEWTRTHSLPGLPVVALLTFFLLLAIWFRGRLSLRVALPTAVALLGLSLTVPDRFTRIPVTLPFKQPIPPEAETVELIVTSLLENLYRAFQLREPEAIYDALAAEVDEDLVESLYLQVLESLRMEDQGGAVSRVQKVSPEMVTVDALPGSGGGEVIALTADWTVSGTVEHWGHIHRRTHRHRADFTLRPRDGIWKIEAFQPLSSERIQMEITLRR